MGRVYEMTQQGILGGLHEDARHPPLPRDRLCGPRRPPAFIGPPPNRATSPGRARRYRGKVDDVVDVVTTEVTSSDRSSSRGRVPSVKSDIRKKAGDITSPPEDDLFPVKTRKLGGDRRRTSKTRSSRSFRAPTCVPKSPPPDRCRPRKGARRGREISRRRSPLCGRGGPQKGPARPAGHGRKRRYDPTTRRPKCSRRGSPC
ncbi:MAG: hypothetical protein CM15mP128_4000 [Methanobacteriota archaeon]|nr:MAG: hypothetical protein CM15mP128_4000 [Euryarchaeota archaeon]